MVPLVGDMTVAADSRELAEHLHPEGQDIGPAARQGDERRYVHGGATR